MLVLALKDEEMMLLSRLVRFIMDSIFGYMRRCPGSSYISKRKLSKSQRLSNAARIRALSSWARTLTAL
jgi:hypothetical protein